MAIPRVPEQVRRAPILAIRALFVGIGRVLMIADRPTPVVVVAQPASEAREPQAASAPPVASQTDDAPTVAGQTDSTPDLPLPNYDVLSLASIRSRLRGLDVTQLKTLLDYEATNAERADVLGMFERRIEKLEAGS